MSAPPSGGPVRVAKLTILKTIPILTPAFFRSVVKLDRVAGKRPWIPAADRPYNTSNAMRALLEEMAAQKYSRIPVMHAHGMTVLIGPKYASAI